MSIDFSALFMVETEALEYSIATSQSQSSFLAPSFFPQSLSTSENHHSSIENKAYAIVGIGKII